MNAYNVAVQTNNMSILVSFTHLASIVPLHALHPDSACTGAVQTYKMSTFASSAHLASIVPLHALHPDSACTGAVQIYKMGVLGSILHLASIIPLVLLLADLVKKPSYQPAHSSSSYCPSRAHLDPSSHPSLHCVSIS